MQNTVYRASRIPIIYAVFLLACAIQVWHTPAVHNQAMGVAVSELFNALQSSLWGYFVIALLGFDGLQELRRRPMCFPVKSVVQAGAAVMLGIGVLGVLLLAYASTLDAHMPLKGAALTGLTPSPLYRVTGSNSWAAVGVLCKAVGVLGVVLVMGFGRRPPRH
jgi:hypothetical protein